MSLTSNGAAFVQPPFGGEISRCGSVFVPEGSNRSVANTRNSDLRNPVFARANPTDAQHPGITVRLRLALVLLVNEGFDITKICKSVVCSVAVDVVNLVLRPFACHVEPRETMSVFLTGAINTNLHVAMLGHAAGGTVGPSSLAAGAPGKRARQRVIVKKFAQTRGAKIGISHEMVTSSSGQRLGSVASAYQASLFSAGRLRNSRGSLWQR